MNQWFHPQKKKNIKKKTVKLGKKKNNRELTDVGWKILTLNSRISEIGHRIQLLRLMADTSPEKL